MAQICPRNKAEDNYARVRLRLLGSTQVVAGQTMAAGVSADEAQRIAKAPT